MEATEQIKELGNEHLQLTWQKDCLTDKRRELRCTKYNKEYRELSGHIRRIDKRLKQIKAHLEALQQQYRPETSNTNQLPLF